jgi:hypothetical protein
MKVLKDKELQTHYEAMFSMFGTDGWKRFMEDVAERTTAIGDIRRLKDGDGLKFAQGQLDVLHWLLGQKEAHDFAYEQLAEEGDE